MDSITGVVNYATCWMLDVVCCQIEFLWSLRDTFRLIACPVYVCKLPSLRIWCIAYVQVNKYRGMVRGQV